MHGRYGEILLCHTICEPVDFSACVAVYDSLGDRQGFVEITQCIQFPFFTFHSDVELLDPFESKLITLHENANWLTHESCRNFENIKRHRSGKETALHVFGQKLKNFINLVFETAREHLISFIKSKNFHVIQTKSASINHVVYTPWRANNNLDAILKSTNVVAYCSSTNTRMHFYVHEIAYRYDNFYDLLCQFTGRRKYKCLALLCRRIEHLENAYCEGRCLASS
mmetsp:Transcript_51715/g.70495  ORF Transcript_51715/g.70495 Transcript_51715/m.70495 type:complete len:225 (+) Transcript_51715:397-1071(+)